MEIRPSGTVIHAARRSDSCPHRRTTVQVIRLPSTGLIPANRAIFYDITIIGAGPTGLFAAFYAGLRGRALR